MKKLLLATAFIIGFTGATFAADVSNGPLDVQCGETSVITKLLTEHNFARTWQGTSPYKSVELGGLTISLYQDPQGNWILIAGDGTDSCKVGSGIGIGK